MKLSENKFYCSNSNFVLNNSNTFDYFFSYISVWLNKLSKRRTPIISGNKDLDHYRMSNEFMYEYESLGHMKGVLFTR